MKIDVTTLNGYNPEMTPEEVLALISKTELPDPDYSGYVPKDSFDKVSSEVAEYKKQLRSKLTEDEQKAATLKAEREAEKEELETLRKEVAIARYRSEFLAIGYDEKLATDTAKAMADGDQAKVFANQKIYIETVRKAERAGRLAVDIDPPAGQGKPEKPERDKLQEQYDEAVKGKKTAEAVALKNRLFELDKK